MNRFNLIIIFLLTILIFSCKESNIEPYTETNFALGTVCSITLYENIKDFNFTEAFNIINDIEDRMSPVIEGSELYNINSNAGIKPVSVSNDTYHVVQEGLRYAKLSESKFDISIGPLVNLWAIGTDLQKLPKPGEILSVIPLIGSVNITINNKDKSVYLEQKGMAIDLGGIAKGYAADLVKDFLLQQGFTKGIINLGGNVLTFGSKASGIPWKIGIQNPSGSRGKYIGTLETGETSIVTSGIYERFFEKDGKRYHHILDPESGYPINNELLSITIVTASGITADAYSTVIFSLGLLKGMELLESQENMDGIFITKENKIYTTSGLKESFNLLSSDFILVN